MKVVIDALATATNFATLIRDESEDRYQRNCANRTLAKLEMAINRLSQIHKEKEEACLNDSGRT